MIPTIKILFNYFPHFAAAIYGLITYRGKQRMNASEKDSIEILFFIFDEWCAIDFIIVEHTTNESFIVRFYWNSWVITKQRFVVVCMSDEHIANELSSRTFYSNILPVFRDRFRVDIIIHEYKKSESFIVRLCSHIFVMEEKRFRAD